MRSPDQRFVCQVGAHVAGAAQVQRYLRENAGALAAQGLHHLPRELMSAYVGWGPRLVEDPAPFADELRHALELPGIHGLLASHENTIGKPFGADDGGLYAGARQTLEVLAEVAKPYRCTVVLSVRPQAQFLESYYLQTVNQGEWDAFPTWLGRLNLDDISWLPLYEQLTEAFGSDAVRVLGCENAGADPAADVREFFRLIDVRLPTPPRFAAHRSPRPSERGLRMSLAANPYLRTYDERVSLRRFLQKSFSERDYPPATLLTDEQRAFLDERYSGEYRRLVAAQP